MLDFQTVFCGVGLPILFVGVLIFLQARARDLRAEEHRSHVLSLLAVRATEVYVSPESSRSPYPSGAYQVTPRVPPVAGLSHEDRDAVVALLSRDGAPMPAARYAEVLGISLEPEDLHPTGPAYLVGPGVVSYRNDDRAERNALEGVIRSAIGTRHHTREDVLAIAARLTAPALVASQAT